MLGENDNASVSAKPTAPRLFFKVAEARNMGFTSAGGRRHFQERIFL